MNRLLAALFAAWISIVPAFADSTINNLGAGSAVQGTDILPAYQGANPATGVTAAQIKAYVAPVAASNLTYFTSASGTGTACSSGAPCSFGTAISQAATYNWNSQYFPTINVANGTYAGVQLTLPALINCANGGVIAFGTNVVVNDAGTGWTFNNTSFSNWNFTGTLSLGGTYAGIQVLPGSILNTAGLSLTFSGTLPNGGLNIEEGGYFFGTGMSINTTNSAMGSMVFYRGFVNLDSSTITFTNAISFSTNNHVIAGDSTGGFFAFVGGKFVNPGNVTAATPLILDNGAFFEADSTSLSGGASLTSANFPGVSNGGANSVDNTSTFQPQLVVIASGADPSFTSVKVNNTTSGGHEAILYEAGSPTGVFGQTAGAGGLADITNGNLIYTWDTSGNFQLFGALQWSAAAIFTYSPPDTSLSRTGAAALAAGNGTPGDTSGTLRFAAHFAGGTVPTGTTGSCSASAFAGGKTAGKFTAPSCAGGTIILSGLPTAPNGYTCNAQDQTTPTDALQQTANSVSSVTFKATTAASDVVVFQCTGW